MSVYVDDAGIPAKVRNGSRVHDSRWYHLTADTPGELHRFAEGLGLKRSYFQGGEKHGDLWHYDLTEGKRQQAIKQGAQQVTWRDMPGICRNRVPQGPECTLAGPCGLEGCRACYPELPPRRLLVTASRTWTDEGAIREELTRRYQPGMVLVSGHCPAGGDAIAERVWRELGGQVEEHPADWRAHGKSAGHRRNAVMVRSGPDEAVAFILDGSPGATGCAQLAEKAGIPVDRFERHSQLHSHADLAQMADKLSAEAGQAWRDGKHLEAARLMRQAAEADESRPDLWGKRLAWIHDHARDLPLAVGTQVRLAAAGIRAADPEMRQVTYHNYRARIRAGHAVKPAEAEPAKQPERALDDTEPGQ